MMYVFLRITWCKELNGTWFYYDISLISHMPTLVVHVKLVCRNFDPDVGCSTYARDATIYKTLQLGRLYKEQPCHPYLRTNCHLGRSQKTGSSCGRLYMVVRLSSVTWRTRDPAVLHKSTPTDTCCNMIGTHYLLQAGGIESFSIVT